MWTNQQRKYNSEYNFLSKDENLDLINSLKMSFSSNIWTLVDVRDSYKGFCIWVTLEILLFIQSSQQLPQKYQSRSRLPSQMVICMLDKIKSKKEIFWGNNCCRPKTKFQRAQECCEEGTKNIVKEMCLGLLSPSRSGIRS